MKKDIKTWAIKLRGRSFYQNQDGIPFFFSTKSAASIIALRVEKIDGTKAEPVRIKMRVEETV